MVWGFLNRAGLSLKNPLRAKRAGPAIRAAGAKLLFLPQCSPDVNPIEQVLSKLKTLLRKANARTFEAIEAAIAAILTAITTTVESRNFFREAGSKTITL